LGLEAATPAIDNFEVVGSRAQQVSVLYNDLFPVTETPVQLQLFLGTADKVYIVDKTENNPTPIHTLPGQLCNRISHAMVIVVEHPVQKWPMDAITNSFCSVPEFSPICHWQFV